MRLTLRTLLAYMDDILEPADHEDLGKKIEASDFATELIHRSRDTVRRLRLGAPEVHSEGSDDVLDSLDLGDANAVAEYLDNTLPPEQVAEFERMCLEPGTKPDMHLAEVASCHHVLTMVLGEPAEVDSALKERMYKLPQDQASGQKLRIEPTHAVAAPPAAEAAPPAQAPVPTAPPIAQPASLVDSEIPDYLREAAASKRRSRNWAIAITLLMIGGVGAWLAVPTETEVPAEIAKVDSGVVIDGEVEIEMDEGVAVADSSAGDPKEMEPAPPFNAEATENTPAPAFVPGAGAPVEPAATEEPAVLEEDLTTQETAADEMPLELNNSVPPPPIEPKVVDVDERTDRTTVGGEPIVTDLPELTVNKPEATMPAESETVSSGEQPVLIASTPQEPIPSEVPTATELPADEPEEPAGPRRLGNYLGNDDVLLFYNPDQQNWIRMPPRSPIATGDELLTMPKFFTHVVLADVNTYLSGGTRVRIPVEPFESSTSDAPLNLEIVYGRALFNSGLEGSKISVMVEGQLREFQLDGSSSLAVDVQRMFVPGNDYENQAAPTIATWYLTSGTVQWPTATGGTQTIRGEMIWRTIDGVDEIPEPVAQLPEWIGREPMTDMERSARDDLSKELRENQPVEIRLRELTDGKGLGRRKEVRVLAAASSVYVGEFELLVRALEDSDQDRAWDTHIHDLRQAVALSPDVAASVSEAFVKIRGEEAAEDLFEMVQGYNSAQVGTTREAVQMGALAQLIKWLDHERLDYRVLAINNIRSITGKNKVFRPADSVKNRKKNLRRIIAEFESNELMEL